MSGSVSACRRLAMGEPTMMSWSPVVAMQQSLECGQQGHEQRGALALAQRLERRRQLPRQLQPFAGAAKCLHRRPRAIGRQLQHRWFAAELPGQ